MAIVPNGSVMYISTTADKIRKLADPYRAAVAQMVYRDNHTFDVVFHFADGSTLTFRKEFHLENV